MIAESRKRNRFFFALIQNLIITISYNAAKCFVKSSLILGITKAIDKDKICVSINYRLAGKPYFFLILFFHDKSFFYLREHRNCSFSCFRLWSIYSVSASLCTAPVKIYKGMINADCTFFQINVFPTKPCDFSNPHSCP